MNNNVVGVSGEVALCKIFGIQTPESLINSSDSTIVDNILSIKKDIIKQTSNYNIILSEYVGENGSSVDFVAKNNITVSVKTFKGSKMLVCPQNIGQASTKSFINKINNIAPNSIVESDNYFCRVDAIKNFIYSNPTFLLQQYVRNTFHTDYLLLIYNVCDKPEFICVDCSLYDFEFENVSFSKTIQDWQSSNTVYSNNIPVGSFQLHSNRDCVKFRFDFRKLFQTLNVKNSSLRFENIDCLDFLATLPDCSVDLVLIDPPYNISRPTGFSNGEKKNTSVDRFRISYEFGDWDSNDQKSVLDKVFKQCYRVLRKNGSIVCFYDIWKIGDIKHLFEKHQFRQVRFLEWVKTNPVPINSKINYLTNSREAIVSAVKHSKPTFNSQYHNGIYSYPICHSKERFHTAEKPVELLEELLSVHSNVGDKVLDCFAGSASTGVACKNTGRVFVGCEKDLRCFILAYQRLFK